MPTRVAILGGGPAALAAAFELTDRDPRAEVTVYQPGWRLGGKCASGRNPELGYRIEEHGLHVWFGCYDNARHLMERVYGAIAESQPSWPTQAWEDAFEGIDHATLWQLGPVPGHVTLHFEPNGEEDVPGGFDEWATAALRWAAQRCVDVDAQLGHPSLPRFVRYILPRLVDAVVRVGTPVVTPVLEVVTDAIRATGLVNEPTARFYLDTVDLLIAAVHGIVDEDLAEEGFDTINDVDLAVWLERHGADIDLADPERWPALLRAVYCGSFAFADGDTAQPTMAAGRALQGMIRVLFHYRGSVLYRTKGSMGDVVIAPLYELLRERGVRFRFFHAVEGLDVGAEGVSAVHMVQQVGGEVDYQPLIDVPTATPLRTWPSEPLWNQLPTGTDRSAPHRYEFEINPYPERARRCTLRAGEHFDAVVLAVPPDVQSGICGSVKAADEDYARFLESFKSVATLGVQAWLTQAPAGLGQPYVSTEPPSLTSCYREPLDTYADMAHLLPLECWDEQVKHLAYFCGVMRDHDDADALVGAFLEGAGDVPAQSAGLFPATGGLPAATRHGPVYVRANLAPTERYGLTPPGSVACRPGTRLPGLDNLFLAGDWTVNGLDTGCVEAAITSGLLAADAILAEGAGPMRSGVNGPPGFPN
jgi:uncharacterized protein with NAD-binding domain and iron-sulfur cluster